MAGGRVDIPAGGLRLLVLVNHYAPDRGGGGAAYTDLCRCLAQRGVEVTVACPYPFYPEWRDKSGRNGLRLWRYEEAGVSVVRYGLMIPRNPRALLPRLVFELALFFSALRVLQLAGRADAVMAFCPYFGIAAAAALIQPFYGKPCWLNVQDVTSDAAHATGMVRSPWLARLMASAERLVFNRFPTWSSISPVMVERLATMRQRGQEIALLPNWLDEDRREAIGHGTSRAGPDRPVRLLYAGNIAGKQDLLRFCRFLSGATCPFRFRIFGSGGEAKHVREWIESQRDARFSFGGFLGAEDLARELQDADFHVITERAGSGASYFPSKYVGGIAAGTPVLAVCDPDSPLGREVVQAGTGALLEWSELATAPGILEIDPDEWRIWRHNCLERARHFDRDTLVDDLMMRLQRLAHADTPRDAQ